MLFRDSYGLACSLFAATMWSMNSQYYSSNTSMYFSCFIGIFKIFEIFSTDMDSFPTSRQFLVVLQILERETLNPNSIVNLNNFILNRLALFILSEFPRISKKKNFILFISFMWPTFRQLHSNFQRIRKTGSCIIPNDNNAYSRTIKMSVVVLSVMTASLKQNCRPIFCNYVRCTDVKA